MYAEVYDVAGNKTRTPSGSSTVSVSILKPELKIADYVYYNMTLAKKEITLLPALTGTSTTQTLTTRQEYGFAVLSMNSDYVTLLGRSEEFYYNPNYEVALMGPTGYNNGIYVLNYVANSLYSNPDFEAVARSATLEDYLNDLLPENKKLWDDNVRILETGPYTTQIPLLATYENDISINGAAYKANGISHSDQGSGLPISIPLSESDLVSYSNSFSNTLTWKTKVSIYPSGWTLDKSDGHLNWDPPSGQELWLATRHSNAGFGLMSIIQSKFYYRDLVNNSRTNVQVSKPIRSSGHLTKKICEI